MPESATSTAAPTLADLTTLRLGGPADRVVTATTEHELIAAVQAADEAGESLLVLGGGSNLVVADDGFRGTVVRVATRGLTEEADMCSGAMVTVAAGEPWDDVVATAVERRWTGIEALSGIPGSTGATPIQNVGAYGQEVAQTIARVRTWDRHDGVVRTFFPGDCGFGYRTSRFKSPPRDERPGRHVVLSVTFQLGLGGQVALGPPVQYAELARALGIEVGRRAPIEQVREAVLALRGGKGMVLDPDDHDTWSAGSFFTNPVVPAEAVPDGAPAWPQPETPGEPATVKTSAAWLIEHAGFTKGYTRGRVGLSTKHTLALTNRGGATTAELLALATEIRDGVELAFGIRLVNEPVLLGCRLP